MVTVRKIIEEFVYLAPEMLNDEKFLGEWSDHKFGVSMDDELVKYTEGESDKNEKI